MSDLLKEKDKLSEIVESKDRLLKDLSERKAKIDADIAFVTSTYNAPIKEQAAKVKEIEYEIIQR